MRKLLFLASFEYTLNDKGIESNPVKEWRIIVVEERDLNVVFKEMGVASQGSSVPDHMTTAYVKGMQWFRRRVSKDAEVKCTIIPAIDGIIVPEESFE